MRFLRTVLRTVGNIISSIEFWKVVFPLLIAIFVWHLNQNSQRQWEQYKRKEESYKELVRNLRGFYVDFEDRELKQKFIEQVNLCWLYAPDDVIERAYDFLNSVYSGSGVTQEHHKIAVGELMVTIRKDMLSGKIVQKTDLTSADFKHLKANK